MTSKSWSSLGATAAICAAVALWPAPGRARQATQTVAKPADNPTALVNQIQMLRADNARLLGKIEQLQHDLEQLRQINKEQYLALDDRLHKLEAQPAPASTGKSTPASKGKPASGSAPKPPVPVPGPPPEPAKAVPPQAAASSSAPATAGSSISPADEAAAQVAYDAAFNTLRAGNFEASKQQFQAFVQRYPQAHLTPNAWYWLGESYYVTQDYPHALAAFEQVLKRFPASSKAPGAMLKKGYSQYAMHKNQAAVDTLNQLVAKYPHSSVAQLAVRRLQDIQLQKQLQ